ncbi:MAG: bifunctional DNA-formamidopyrimidine glycosylase/DNA-(apurinic or apyrimidinic site) lyase [Succinivibrio sp.]|nr:bifunctional DNA-formamidopyrimidine glycosylase/DNA-(apurinic or apyrimidinic site) lyase [Succinivibrio sp.]
MPELPEVEVTKRGIEKPLLNAIISSIYFDDKSLRKPFSPDLKKLEKARVLKIERRAKYIVITTTNGYLLLHLGMTGHLRVLDQKTPMDTHDHFEISLQSGVSIRYNDIRRFGLVLYFDKTQDPYQCEPLKSLGPEPFSEEFTSEYLYSRLHRLKKSIKQALMDNSIVVGVGNIYASEVLFLTKISPLTPSNKITQKQCDSLVEQIPLLLKESIKKGGTTIRDFSGADGKLGYFVQNLYVYGHEGEPCRICGTKIVSTVQGQRSTFYCQHCQK